MLQCSQSLFVCLVLFKDHATYTLCTISLAISYVTHLFCAHLCALPINFNCNDENRILGK